MGDAALLLETDDVDAVLTLHATLAPRVEAGEGVWGEVGDLVPGARTLLVLARPTTDLGILARALTDAASGATPPVPPAVAQGEVEVPVVYDGPDLAEVARLTGLDAAEVVRAHTGTAWRVGFGGFAPGFAYLVGGDPRLHVPRRAEPRTRVPAGAVGLAGGYSGIYPRASPGGWQLLGSTDVVLWDAGRRPPALLVPGTTVRFVVAGR